MPTLNASSPQTVSPELWVSSLKILESELGPAAFNGWIRPLKAEYINQELTLLAHNDFTLSLVQEKFANAIRMAVGKAMPEQNTSIRYALGNFDEKHSPTVETPAMTAAAISADIQQKVNEVAKQKEDFLRHSLNPKFTFDAFVEGKANQLPYAAAQAVANSPGEGYNPFFVYGGVGLGKTHLMHAIGNALIRQNPTARVLCITSEKFVKDMVTAIQHKKTAKFQQFYRSLDALLIDDIQFFAGKSQSQEEFFHTFNTLLEGNKQIIMTSDRLPKEVSGLDDRLISRFGWGLSMPIDPPDLEMRTAILMKKASIMGKILSHDVAHFLANHLATNVRELEGALNRVIAYAGFKDQPITVELATESLKDILVLQEKLVSIENIQRQVASYYKIRIADLLSKSRSRNITRPRQMAMALCKELTQHSLPEIGNAFGGRDHTTALHAIKKVDALRATELKFAEEYQDLLRILTT